MNRGENDGACPMYDCACDRKSTDGCEYYEWSNRKGRKTMELVEAMKRIERFLGGLEAFDLLSPRIREAWIRIEAEIAKEMIRNV